MLEFVKFESVSLKDSAEFNEKWVQDRIAEDPSILGLGELILLNKEVIQPGAGRLDLLLQDQDPDSNQRYEVELQLGRVDESHIIRTIEYWDIERKRYPQYDHTAVIIAEDITSRFLNVISLFNGFIPLVAIQMKTLKYDSKITLDFTKVLDQMQLGMDEPAIIETVDRGYWENRASKNSVAIADGIVELVRSFAPACAPNYNKSYIGVTNDGHVNNFIVLHPKKQFLRLGVRLTRSDEIDEKIDNSGLELIGYSSKNRRYRMRVFKKDLEKHKELLTKLLHDSYSENGK